MAPRGEGESFHAKLRARMIGALTQSGGAWLPAILADLPGEDTYEAADHGGRFFLDVTGEPMLSVATHAPLTIALGPEGTQDVACGADQVADPLGDVDRMVAEALVEARVLGEVSHPAADRDALLNDVPPEDRASTRAARGRSASSRCR